MGKNGRVKKLSLNRETLRVLQDSKLESVVGGGTQGTLYCVDPNTEIETRVYTLCGSWVSTGPPTQTCQ